MFLSCITNQDNGKSMVLNMELNLLPLWVKKVPLATSRWFASRPRHLQKALKYIKTHTKNYPETQGVKLNPNIHKTLEEPKP